MPIAPASAITYDNFEMRRPETAHDCELIPRMIVDVHTHLPSHKDHIPPEDVKIETTMRSGETVHLTNTIADYLRSIEPVDKAFLFGIAPRPWKLNSPIFEASDDWPPPLNHNDVAAEVASHAPEKIIPFMSLHPLAEDVNEEYDRAVGDLGCKGIKLGPNYQDFDPLSPEAFHLFARLEHDGLPIVFHQGTSAIQDAPLMYAHRNGIPSPQDRRRPPRPPLAGRLPSNRPQAPQRLG